MNFKGLEPEKQYNFEGLESEYNFEGLEPELEDPRRFGIPEGAGEPISTITGKPLTTDFGKPKESDVPQGRFVFEEPEPTWGEILKKAPASGLAHVNVGLARLARDTIKLADLPASVVRKTFGIEGKRPDVKFLEDYMISEQKRQGVLDVSEELSKLSHWHPKRIIGTGLQAVPQVAAVAGGALMGAPFIGGAKSAAMMLGTIAYGPSAEEAKTEGANEIQQILHGITAAEIEVLTELPVFRAVGQIWKHLKRFGVAKKAGVGFAKRLLTGLGIYGKGMALESAQELEAYLGGQVSKRLHYDPNATINFKDAVEATYGGFAMSATLGIAGVPGMAVKLAGKGKATIAPETEPTTPQKATPGLDREATLNNIKAALESGEATADDVMEYARLPEAEGIVDDLNALVIDAKAKEELAPEIEPEILAPEARQEIIEAEMPTPIAPTAEVAREPVGVEIPEFKTTGEALIFGKKATAEQKELLKQRREIALKRSKELRAAKDFDGAMVEATKSQFDREALDAKKILVEHPEFEPEKAVTGEKVEKKENLKALPFIRLAEKSDEVQTRIDAKIDELEAIGLSWEELNKNPELENLYEERSRYDDAAFAKGYEGARRIITNEIGEGVPGKTLYASIDSILSDHYSLIKGKTGAAMMSKYTGKDLNNDEKTIKNVAKDISKLLLAKDNPKADFFATMESTFSGLTKEGKEQYLKEGLAKAKVIHEKIKRFFINEQVSRKALPVPAKLQPPKLPAKAKGEAATKDFEGKGIGEVAPKELKPIGTFKASQKDTFGNFHEVEISVLSMSEPINVRGKVSSGNWKVDFETPSELGKTGKQTQSKYFWKKTEAATWIDEIESQEVKKAKPEPKKEAAPGPEIKSQISEAYFKLSKGDWNKRVRLSDLKSALSDLDWNEVSMTLREMALSDDRNVVLNPLDFGGEITQADKDSAIETGEGAMHIVHIARAVEGKAKPQAKVEEKKVAPKVEKEKVEVTPEKKPQFYKVIVNAPDGRFGSKVIEGGLDKKSAEHEAKSYKKAGMVVSVVPEIVSKKVETETTPEGKEISVDLTKKEEAAVTPKEQKEYLLAEIDKAIETELKTEGFGKGIEDAKELLKRRINPLTQSKTTYKFEVPNDGTFEITGSALFEFQSRVKSAFPATIISKKFKPIFENKKAIPTAKYNKILGKAPKELKPADIDRIFEEVAGTEARDIAGAIQLNPFQNWLLSQDITKAVKDKIRSVAGKDYIEEARVKIETQDIEYARSMVEHTRGEFEELQSYYNEYKAGEKTLKQIAKKTEIKRSGHELAEEASNAKSAYYDAVAHLEKLEKPTGVEVPEGKKFATKEITLEQEALKYKTVEKFIEKKLNADQIANIEDIGHIIIPKTIPAWKEHYYKEDGKLYHYTPVERLVFIQEEGLSPKRRGKMERGDYLDNKIYGLAEASESNFESVVERNIYTYMPDGWALLEISKNENWTKYLKAGKDVVRTVHKIEPKNIKVMTENGWIPLIDINVKTKTQLIDIWDKIHKPKFATKATKPQDTRVVLQKAYSRIKDVPIDSGRIIIRFSDAIEEDIARGWSGFMGERSDDIPENAVMQDFGQSLEFKKINENFYHFFSEEGERLGEVKKDPNTDEWVHVDHEGVAGFDLNFNEYGNTLGEITQKLKKVPYSHWPFGESSEEGKIWQEDNPIVLFSGYLGKNKDINIILVEASEKTRKNFMSLIQKTIRPALSLSKERVKPQDTITRADLKSIFSKMKNISTGVNKDGNFFFRPFGKSVVTIYEVNHIEGYIDTSSGRIPVGSYLRNKMELKTEGVGPTADVITAWHEFTHFLEDNNIISSSDVKALSEVTAQDLGINVSDVTSHQRGDYVGKIIEDWRTQTNTRIKRILRKISSFIDAVTEFMGRTRTAKDILRDIESGKILAEKKEALTGVNQFAQDVAFSLKKAAKAITDNPNFRKWFKNSAVIDKIKNPLVVYHGTHRDFSVFDKNWIGSTTDYGYFGQGFYFSQSAEYASGYAKRAIQGGNVMPVYLTIQKPFIFEYATSDTATETRARAKGIGAKLNTSGIPAKPAEFLRQLKANGYDGVIVKTTNGRNEYAVFEPTQIKSIFNTGAFGLTEKDIRYQMAGISAIGAPTGQLAKAQEMLAEGKDKKEVWRETGWIKMKDGWKFEIDDSAAKLLQDASKKTHGDNTKLNKFLKHDTLFNAYPELESMDVRFRSMRQEAGSLRKNPATGESEIYLDPRKHTEAIELLMHEVQHKIQEIEGFAKGGSPESVLLESHAAEIETLVKNNTHFADLRKQEDDLIEQGYSRISPERKDINDEMQSILSKHIKEKYGKKSPEYEYYLHLAGEIEARDTSARAKLTPKQRREQLPYESQGIPEDQWIITEGKGTSFSVLPKEGLSKQKGSSLDNEGMELNYTVHIDRHYGYTDGEYKLISDKIYSDDVGLNLKSDSLQGLKDEITKGKETKQFATKPTKDYSAMFKKYQVMHTIIDKSLKDIPPQKPPKLPSEYEQGKDSWFGNKDWAEVRNAIERGKLQDVIRDTVSIRKNIFGKKIFDRKSRDVDAAIHLYLDLKRNPDHRAEYYKDLPGEWKRIVDKIDLVETNPKLKAIADHIRKEGDATGKLALESDVIHNQIENHVNRVWKKRAGISEKIYTDALQKFKTKSRHAKHRVFDTILEGLALKDKNGKHIFDLQIRGATSNLQTLKDEISRVIEDKKLITEMRKMKTEDGDPLLSTHRINDTYIKIEHPNFKVWEFATSVDLAEKEIDKVTGLAVGDFIRARDRGNIGKVIAITDESVDVHFVNKKEGTEKTVSFARDMVGKLERPLIKVNPKGINFFIADDGTVLEKRELYAPEKIARDLNKILGVSRLKGVRVMGVPAIDILTKYNAIFKSWILVTSFFHHQAFLRSYYLPSQHKTRAEWNPFKAYKMGKKAIEDMTPEIELLVRNGLTMFKMQDWEESVLRREDTIFGKILDKNTKSKAIKDKINELRERQANFLFGNFGAALKTQAALIELRNMTRKHPDMDVQERAKMVARLINDDFGGLHLGRMGRDPTIQHIMRLGLLAPDWSESNVRTMVKALRSPGGAEETAMYRRFWTSAITKGLSMIFAANILMVAFDDDDFEERYKKAWKAGHFRWLDIDITPVYKMLGGESEAKKYFSLFGHFRDPLKFIRHPIRSLHHKGSVVYGTFHEAMAGTDWKGQRFTTLSELVGVDDKGVYLTTTKTHKTGDPKGSKLAGKLVTYGAKGPISLEQMPSYIVSQLIGVQPIQVQNLIAMLTGEVAAFDGIARSLGMHTGTTYPTTKSIREEFIEEYMNLKKERKSIVSLHKKVRKYNLKHKGNEIIKWSNIIKNANKRLRLERILTR